MAEILTTVESDLSKLVDLGLFTGMGDVYLAMMTKEDTPTTKPEYGKPYLACEGISCGLTPQYAQGKQSASDRTIRNLSLLTGMDVKVEYPRVLPAVRCHMLGRELDANGGELVGDGMAPQFAVGVYATRDDGTYLMRWIYKVRFHEGTTNMQTMEDGTLNYQIPTIEGNGVRLAYKHTGADGKPVRLTEYCYDSAGKENPLTPEQFFAQVRGPWDEAAS